MNLSLLEKSYDNLLFVVDYTVRKVLHAVCRLSDEVIHRFYRQGIDGWSSLLKLFLPG